MSGAIDFDENTAKALERMYTTPDVVAQRAEVMRALELRQGERVLDVGVGPGLLMRDLAATVGETGRAAGVDASAAMVEMTRARCADLASVDVREAEATSLPFDDESFDAVVSTQVYEYVTDMDTALSEVARVLVPGGRVVILDTDWDSLVWNTRDRARMRRVLDVWDEHLHDPHLPASLGRRLEDAGLRTRPVQVIPLVNAAYHPHCYSYGILRAIQLFVSDRGGVSKQEAHEWAEELIERGRQGDYFFSLNRYLFSACKDRA